MAFSGLYQPLGNTDDFDDVSLTPNCYFEVSNFQLDGMLNWALMSNYYLEQKSNRQNVFKLSLIGFHGKVSSNHTADYLSVKRDKAMAMVRTLYVSTFTQNEDDIEGIDTALANATTYAIFVSTGTVKKRGKKQGIGTTKYF
jgi:hypothetical protein